METPKIIEVNKKIRNEAKKYFCLGNKNLFKTMKYLLINNYYFKIKFVALSALLIVRGPNPVIAIASSKIKLLFLPALVCLNSSLSANVVTSVPLCIFRWGIIIKSG